jgi:predicted nucleic acid-binding protein
MIIYFFDTSALVKRYHQEIGTNVIDLAFRDDADKVICDIAVIEFYSAFARKVRTGEISEDTFRETVKALAEDIRSGRIRLSPVTDFDKKEALTLIEKWGLSNNLRTLDALQLAVMKRNSSLGEMRVYCSDSSFVTVVEQEGLAVTNPERPSQTNQ